MQGPVFSCYFPSPGSPSFLSSPGSLFREAVFCGICRSLANVASSPQGTSQLLVPSLLQPYMDSALNALVDLVDGVQPPPACTAMERSFLAFLLPRGVRMEDLTRVCVKYLQARAARSEGLSGGSRPPPAEGGGVDLLAFSCGLHTAEVQPGWVGVVAPELLLSVCPPTLEGSAPPSVDALSLNTTLALLMGAPSRPLLHLHFLAPRDDAAGALAAVLQRAAFPLLPLHTVNK